MPDYKERRSMTGIALRWSHVAIFLVGNLLSLGAIYGTMKAEIAEARTQIKELQDRAIGEREFKEFAEDTKRRLTRIEEAIDRKKAIEALQ
jgi:hypothetical protein